MATTYTYEIEEMEGREGVRMAWKSLKDTAHKYSNRRVSLNERFSLIHRGYHLTPVGRSGPESFAHVQSVELVPVDFEGDNDVGVDEPLPAADAGLTFDKKLTKAKDDDSPKEETKTKIPSGFAA